METFTGKIIGIDLGTTNSCGVAIMDGTQARVLRTCLQGDRTTPSIIAYTRIKVKPAGLKRLNACGSDKPAKHSSFAIKRLIGRRFRDEEAQRDVSIIVQIIGADNGDAWLT